MESDVEFIIGNTGSGKTSLAAARISQNDMCYLNDRYLLAKAEIEEANKYRKKPLSLPPQGHVVFADFDIKNNRTDTTSYPMTGYEFGVPNPYQKTKRIMKYGVYAFDEIWEYWSRGEITTLPPWVLAIFNLRRHKQIKIYLIGHALTALHSDLRKVVNVFTLVEKSEHTYLHNGKHFKTRDLLGFGKIIKTVWTGRRFTNEAEFIKYQEGDKTLGEPYKFVYEGDIRTIYNPYSHAHDFDDSEEDFIYDQVIYEDRPTEWDNFKQLMKEAAKLANKLGGVTDANKR